MEKIERQIPKPFEVYKHFKGKLYQILNIAVHSETKETLVIYQALYGDFGIYARPLDMFLSEVDSTKYPDSKEKYRFAKINPATNQLTPTYSKSVSSNLKSSTPVQTDTSNNLEQIISSNTVEPVNEENVLQRAQELFIEFLDEDDFMKKRNILKAISSIATESMINNMAASLDLVASGTSRDSDIKMIDDYIRARIHFDGTRLRKCPN